MMCNASLVTVVNMPAVIPQRPKFAGLDIVSSPMASRRTGHTRPAPPIIDINGPGRLRVGNLMALFNIAHSTVYSRLRTGEIPPRDGKDGNIPYWFTSTIRPYLIKP